MFPKLSVCIPAYNRAKYLQQVLDSVLRQKEYLHEIVICEDKSPQRDAIRKIVTENQEKHNGLIVYQENEKNTGFDGNLRQLLQRASGDYCIFLGNDDILCDGALLSIGKIISQNPSVGVLLRAYGWFEGAPDNVIQEVRYFSSERIIPKGLEALSFCYRRACVLAGLTIIREPALALATDRFDGSLFYQLHCVGSLVFQFDGAYVPNVVALCRSDERPDFGHASAEKGKFTPGEYTIDARLQMVGGIVKIAEALEESHPGALNTVLSDLANYSLPWLSYHADKSRKVFFQYYRALGKLGLQAYPMFHIYYISLFLFGHKNLDKLVKIARRIIGHTPQFGRKS